MAKLYDNVWQRRGVSWIWDDEALSEVYRTSEVVSLRQLMRFSEDRSFQLPSNEGNSLVVGGLDFCLASMTPRCSEVWLQEDLKGAILAFQDEFAGEAALIFRIPSGEVQLRQDIATGYILWKCTIPHSSETIEFGRLLWGEGTDQPKEIAFSRTDKSIGWFHPRLS